MFHLVLFSTYVLMNLLKDSAEKNAAIVPLYCNIFYATREGSLLQNLIAHERNEI